MDMFTSYGHKRLDFSNIWSQIKQNNISDFHPLKVVGRGSETQLQVGDKLIKL